MNAVRVSLCSGCCEGSQGRFRAILLLQYKPDSMACPIPGVVTHVLNVLEKVSIAVLSRLELLSDIAGRIGRISGLLLHRVACSGLGIRYASGPLLLPGGFE